MSGNNQKPTANPGEMIRQWTGNSPMTRATTGSIAVRLETASKEEAAALRPGRRHDPNFQQPNADKEITLYSEAVSTVETMKRQISDRLRSQERQPGMLSSADAYQAKMGSKRVIPSPVELIDEKASEVPRSNTEPMRVIAKSPDQFQGIPKSHTTHARAPTGLDLSHQLSKDEFFGHHEDGTKYIHDMYYTPGRLFDTTSENREIALPIFFWITFFVELIIYSVDIAYAMGYLNRWVLLLGVIHFITYVLFFVIFGAAVWWWNCGEQTFDRTRSFTNYHIFDSSPVMCVFIWIFFAMIYVARAEASDNIQNEVPYALYIPVIGCWVLYDLIICSTRFINTEPSVEARLNVFEEMGLFGEQSFFGFHVSLPKTMKVVGNKNDVFNLIFMDTVGMLHKSNLCDVFALVIVVFSMSILISCVAVFSFHWDVKRFFSQQNMLSGKTAHDNAVYVMCSMFVAAQVWIAFMAIKVTWKIERLRQYLRTIRYKLTEKLDQENPGSVEDVLRYLEQAMEARTLLINIMIPGALRYAGRFFSIAYFPLLMMAVIFCLLFLVADSLVAYETIIVNSFILGWCTSFLIPLAMIGKLEDEGKKHVHNLGDWKSYLQRAKRVLNDDVYRDCVQDIEVWQEKIEYADTGIVMTLMGCLTLKAGQPVVVSCIAIVLACLTVFFARVAQA